MAQPTYHEVRQENRLLRPAVVNRQVWGGKRTAAGAHARGVLRSVLGTARLLQVEAVQFIALVLRALPGRRPLLPTRDRGQARPGPTISAKTPGPVLRRKQHANRLQFALDKGIPMINAEAPDAGRAYVERAVAAGLTVTVGRTNDVGALRRLVALPIWGIHSDFPDRVVKAIGDRQRA